MSDPLKGLKKAMNHTVFSDMTFSQKQMSSIENQITKQRSSQDYSELQENLGVHLLQHLSSSPETGTDLLQKLASSGKAASLSGNEGDLYVILHKMEQNQLIRSQWMMENERRTRIYYIEKKGEKLLNVWNKTEDPDVKASLIFQIEGGLG